MIILKYVFGIIVLQLLNVNLDLENVMNIEICQEQALKYAVLCKLQIQRKKDVLIIQITEIVMKNMHHAKPILKMK